MNTLDIESIREMSQQIPLKCDYIKMLILFGSRATGRTHANSDWDFAVLCDEEKRQGYTKENPLVYFEIPLILGKIFGINPDTIDIVELNKSSQLISHYVVRDGIILYEQEEGEFEKFKQKSLLDNGRVEEIYQDLQQDINKFLKKWAV